MTVWRHCDGSGQGVVISRALYLLAKLAWSSSTIMSKSHILINQARGAVV